MLRPNSPTSTFEAFGLERLKPRADKPLVEGEAPEPTGDGIMDFGDPNNSALLVLLFEDF